MGRQRFSLFAWITTVYTLLVIPWGAYVRATKSGAGCGAHWPTCDGQALPLPSTVAMGVELSHRLSSALLLLMAIGLVVFAVRSFPAGHTVRKLSWVSLGFVLLEALVGGALVLFHLVNSNTSVARAGVMSIHLVNTFLLVSAMALTAYRSGHSANYRLRGQGALGLALAGAMVAVMFLGISGALTALGDTLFPAAGLGEGMAQDVAAGAHFLVRLRMLHPLIAVSVGLYVLLIAGMTRHLRRSPDTARISQWLTGLFIAQIAFGGVNLIFLAPVWMQMIHVLLADCIWIALALLSAAAFRNDVEAVELGAADPSASNEVMNSAATLKAYVALTKPRVISLLLFTTLAAMYIAGHGNPSPWLVLAVAIGGYMAAGSANTINMVIDSDIDKRMKRTAGRPTVTRTIPARKALWFALALGAGSFALLTFAANLLTAMLAFAGLVFYVIVYTMALKRRTWHNIVIGGAAGAFPPLVGWAAVTGALSPMAWYLFAIVFVWTPVHFWALALLIKDDYADAGIPMLPVVLGERITVIQIGLYSLLTALVSVMPFVQGHVGGLYVVCAALLNGVLLLRAGQLLLHTERKQASSLFHFSMAYLALLFLVMAMDRAQWPIHVASLVRLFSVG